MRAEREGALALATVLPPAEAVTADGVGAAAAVTSSGGEAGTAGNQVSSQSSAAATATVTAAQSAAPVASAAPAASTASFKVTGQVSCLSGNSVEGVWVQTNNGSAYAPWKGLGNGSTSDWWFTLPTQESYSLHVGCGGSTASWAVATYSPVVSGAHNSFNCYDIAGEAGYGTCVSRP
jgi:hypothetical protein